jgi:hypothetical protein
MQSLIGHKDEAVRSMVSFSDEEIKRFVQYAYLPGHILLQSDKKVKQDCTLIATADMSRNLQESIAIWEASPVRQILATRLQAACEGPRIKRIVCFALGSLGRGSRTWAQYIAVGTIADELNKLYESDSHLSEPHIEIFA